MLCVYSLFNIIIIDNKKASSRLAFFIMLLRLLIRQGNYEVRLNGLDDVIYVMPLLRSDGYAHE